MSRRQSKNPASQTNSRLCCPRAQELARWPQHSHKHTLSLPTATPARPHIPQQNFRTPVTTVKESVAWIGRKVFSSLEGWLPPGQMPGEQISSSLSHRSVLRLLPVIVFSRILGIPSAGIFNLALFHFLCLLPSSCTIRHRDIKPGN